jgi:cathepsin L
MKLAVLTIATIAAVAGADKWNGYTFEQYCADFGKNYPGFQLSERKALFEATLRRVLKHNSEVHTWEMAMNVFSDMTKEEIQRFKGRSPAESTGERAELADSFWKTLKPLTALPESIDWRDRGVVTPVRNQGGCGSCWAFSATAALKTHVALQTGKLLELSPQQLISCSPDPDSCGGYGGCSGSTSWLAFNYSIGVGMTLESDYPYTAKTGTCDPTHIKRVAGVRGYVRLPTNNYTALMNAVATVGPVSIALSADFTSYSAGVFSGCVGDVLVDHAVVLVGYGTDPVGGAYYLVRNSWGEEWGEKGYIRIQRRANDDSNCATDPAPSQGSACMPYPASTIVCGMCGILSDSSFPTGGFVPEGIV